MSRVGLLPWLHRIGYITTLLVIAGLLWAAFRQPDKPKPADPMQAAVVERTRTKDGTLQPGDSGSAFAASLIKKLAAPPALAGNGFRFVAMPQFRTDWFALALWQEPNVAAAQGKVTVFHRGDRGFAAASVREFTVPAATYAAFVQRADGIADGWAGEYSRCYDGLVIAFERVRGDRVTSGTGNASCIKHYHQLNKLMLDFLRTNAPGAAPHVDDGWWLLDPVAQ